MLGEITTTYLKVKMQSVFTLTKEDVQDVATPGPPQVFQHLLPRLSSLAEIRLDNVTKGSINWTWLSSVKGLRRVKVLVCPSVEQDGDDQQTHQERVHVHDDRAEFIHVSEESRNVFQNISEHMQEEVGLCSRCRYAWAQPHS